MLPLLLKIHSKHPQSSKGTFPTQRSIAEGEGSVELDEEKRLCYVAMTRAKTHLVMTWRREVQTFFGQGFKFTHPERSRFLDKLVGKKASHGKKKKSIARNAQSWRNYHSSASSERYGNFENRYNSQGTPSIKRKKALIRNAADFQLGDEFSPQQREVSIKRKKAPIHNSVRGVDPMMQQMMKTKTKAKTKKKKKKSIKRRVQPREKSQIDSSSTLMDSSLFFPAGTVVHHPIHGDGVVAKSKAVAVGELMKVLVEFKSGMTVDFPVHDSGLRIKH